MLPAGTLLAADFESAVKTARQIPFHNQIFVIGGQSIYAAALASGEVDYISAPRVDLFSRADMCVFISQFTRVFLFLFDLICTQLHASYRRCRVPCVLVVTAHES